MIKHKQPNPFIPIRNELDIIDINYVKKVREAYSEIERRKWEGNVFRERSIYKKKAIIGN